MFFARGGITSSEIRRHELTFAVIVIPVRRWEGIGFVVRAETEAEARQFAHGKAGDENRGEFVQRKIANTHEPWLDAKYSTCIELLPDGEAGVVIRDFNAA